MTWVSRVLLATALSAGMLVVRSPQAAADAPVLVDDDRIDSRNHLFFAVPSPDRKSTLVFRRSKKGPNVPQWSMPTWSVMAFLSNDGAYLVNVYPGVNILALDYKPDQVMVSIRRRGHLVRDVHLNELIGDLRALGPRSESGYPWGEYEGFVEPHRFALTTVEHRRIVFDLETGREVDTTAADAATPPSQKRKRP